MKDCIETWLPSLWHPEQEITNIFSGCKAAIEMRDEIVGNLANHSAMNSSSELQQSNLKNHTVSQ